MNSAFVYFSVLKDIIPDKKMMIYRGCGQAFPPVRGRLEYAEENAPSEKYPDYGS